MNTSELNVAVVGVGALGRHHARILSQLEGANLVAVADASAEQAQAVAESCGCEWTDDYRTLLGRIDAVSIVVPTFLHRRIAEDFLLKSIPTLIEKPLTSSVDDGAELVRIANEHDIPLQVGHIERFNPAFAQVQEWCSAPKYIRTERISPYAFRSMDIGVVHDLMIHDIELVLALTGEMPNKVEAMGASLVGGHEDAVQARLTFPGGCIADLTTNRVAPAAQRTMQCWSANGCLQADLHARTVTRFSPGKPMKQGQLPYELARTQQESIETLKPQVFGHFIEVEEFSGTDTDALTAELESFLNCVRTGQRPLVNGADALNALKVAEQVMNSLNQHRWNGTQPGPVGPHALTNPAGQQENAAA